MSLSNIVFFFLNILILLSMLSSTAEAGSLRRAESNENEIATPELQAISIVERHLNGTTHHAHPPPKKKAESSSSSSSSGSSESYSGYTSDESQSAPQHKSAYITSGMAAVAVAGVAAFYHRQNRQVVTVEPAHPLAGSVARRVERFDKMAGQASPQARTGVTPTLDSSYVTMDGGGTPGASTMAMI